MQAQIKIDTTPCQHDYITDTWVNEGFNSHACNKSSIVRFN